MSEEVEREARVDRDRKAIGVINKIDPVVRSGKGDGVGTGGCRYRGSTLKFTVAFSDLARTCRATSSLYLSAVHRVYVAFVVVVVVVDLAGRRQACYFAFASDAVRHTP